MQQPSNQNFSNQEALDFLTAYKEKFFQKEHHAKFDLNKEEFLKCYDSIYKSSKPDLNNITTLIPFILEFSNAGINMHDRDHLLHFIRDYFDSQGSPELKQHLPTANIASDLGFGPLLHSACRLQSLDFVKLIIKIDPGSLNYCDENLNSSFDLALMIGNESIIKFLAEQYMSRDYICENERLHDLREDFFERLIKKNNPDSIRYFTVMAAYAGKAGIKTHIAARSSPSILQAVLDGLQEYFKHGNLNIVNQQYSVKEIVSSTQTIRRKGFLVPTPLFDSIQMSLPYIEKLREPKLSEVMPKNLTLPLHKVLAPKALGKFRKMLSSNLAIKMLENIQLSDMLDMEKTISLVGEEWFSVKECLNQDQKIKVFEARPAWVKNQSILDFKAPVNELQYLLSNSYYSSKVPIEDTPFQHAARNRLYPNMMLLIEYGASKSKLDNVINLYNDVFNINLDKAVDNVSKVDLEECLNFITQRIRILNYTLISGHYTEEPDSKQRLIEIYFTKAPGKLSAFPNPFAQFKSDLQSIIKQCCSKENKDFLGLHDLTQLRKRLSDPNSLLNFVITHKPGFLSGIKEDNSLLNEVCKQIEALLEKNESKSQEALIEIRKPTHWRFVKDIIEDSGASTELTENQSNNNDSESSQQLQELSDITNLLRYKG